MMLVFAGGGLARVKTRTEAMAAWPKTFRASCSNRPQFCPPAFAQSAAGARPSGAERGGAPSVDGGGRRVDGRGDQCAFLLVDRGRSNAPARASGPNHRASGQGIAPVCGGCLTPVLGGLAAGGVLFWGLRLCGPATLDQPAGSGGGRRWAAALSHRDHQGGFLAHQHRHRGVDRARRRHHPIVRHRGLEVGPIGGLAAVSVAAAGGVRRGGGNGRRLQRAHHRARFSRRTLSWAIFR